VNISKTTYSLWAPISESRTCNHVVPKRHGGRGAREEEFRSGDPFANRWVFPRSIARSDLAISDDRDAIYHAGAYWYQTVQHRYFVIVQAF
jgi:hypothetical protein